MGNAGEGRTHGHRHRVGDAWNRHRQMVGLCVAQTELALVSRAPAGDCPVFVHHAGVQPTDGVLAGAQRSDVAQPRGAQMLGEALLASPAGHRAVEADGTGARLAGRQQRVAAAGSFGDRERGRLGACVQAAPQQCDHLGPGHRVVGAVPERILLAAHGDARREQGVDVGLVGAAPGVGEPRGGAPARSKARTSNDAIRARVTVSSGQNRSGSCLQPTVIPRSASRST